METHETQANAFALEGGWLCLGFTNTIGWHAQEEYEERFTSYERILDWCERKRVLDPAAVQRLRREAAGRPEAAERVRQRAIALREAIYHIFSDTADGEEPNPHDVQTLNRELATAWDHLRLAPTGGGFAWEWVAEGNELDRVLWLVARSAAELLTSGPLDRVRECANDPCGWLFVDLSRNRSRRWCDMQDCGNKVKARRHYARTKLNGR